MADISGDAGLDNKYLIAGGVVGLLLLTLMASPLIADQVLVEEQSFTLSANASVVDMQNNTSLGVATGSNQALDFGRLVVNASNSTRYVNVSTPDANFVRLDASGNISEHLNYTKYQMNATSIPVEMQATEVGNFTGNLSVNVQIPAQEGGQQWLELKHSFYSQQ